MDNRIKETFDAVQTPERLKRATKAALRRRTFDYGRNMLRYRQHCRRVVACALSLMLLLSGTGLWFLPVTAIGLNVNPSIELLVNPLDRVIAVKGLNSDGLELVRQLDVYGLPYDEAMQRILISDELGAYMNEDSLISITVVDNRDHHADVVLSKVVCRAYNVTQKENVQYYQVDRQTQKAADAVGLCIPRYLAWQRLKKEDPAVTPEDVRQIPKEEINKIAQIKQIDNPCGK